MAARPARTQVTTQALFGFGKKKEEEGAATAAPLYICVACGYIYDQGDFKKVPGSYKCPVCQAGKSA